MKKRHEQKLVILSLALLLLFNIPLMMIYNFDGVIMGLPVFYVSVFSIWLASVCISYIVLKRFYE